MFLVSMVRLDGRRVTSAVRFLPNSHEGILVILEEVRIYTFNCAIARIHSRYGKVEMYEEWWGRRGVEGLL